MNLQPLVSGRALDDTFAWLPDGPVTVREYLGAARAMAGALPAGDWVLNLCADRYQFAVLFAACLLAGKTSLQPASHAPETLARLARSYPGVLCVTDEDALTHDLPRRNYADLANQTAAPVSEIPCIDAEREVAILFTSGSTGLPQPHGKTWGQLVMNGSAEAHALGLTGSGTALVGTVPVQHSYGFESTFLLALHGGCCLWSGKPFYPQDLVDALLAVPRPRMLVTTPHHLRTLLATPLDMPVMDACLSATAPLDGELAARAEHRLGAPVFEIYGSTESSQLASRRTTDGAAWHLLPGVMLEQNGGEAEPMTHAVGGHVAGRVPLSDVIELLPSGQFILHGRHTDLINIAGKRTSLAYLNHQLCAIDGVLDGAFFSPPPVAGEACKRLTAFVVAPALSRPGLLKALRQRLDPVFLPRPLVWVDGLPRNSTGKLPHSALDALYLAQVTHGVR